MLNGVLYRLGICVLQQAGFRFPVGGRRRRAGITGAVLRRAGVPISRRRLFFAPAVLQPVHAVNEIAFDGLLDQGGNFLIGNAPGVAHYKLHQREGRNAAHLIFPQQIHKIRYLAELVDNRLCFGASTPHGLCVALLGKVYFGIPGKLF